VVTLNGNALENAAVPLRRRRSGMSKAASRGVAALLAAFGVRWTGLPVGDPGIAGRGGLPLAPAAAPTGVAPAPPADSRSALKWARNWSNIVGWAAFSRAASGAATPSAARRARLWSSDTMPCLELVWIVEAS
jgi:hypothetical protein